MISYKTFSNTKLIGLFGVIAILTLSSNSKTYPEDYFRSPVNGRILLSGSFGELRSSHFHSGIDIKPQKSGVAGDALYAVAEGFVSRIKISAFGYGNAIYIQHPNGYTSVYGHMVRLPDSLAAYVKEKQYAAKSFEVDLDSLDMALFPVNKGDVVGYMGTTGYSFGVHLHFEIRETSTQNALNPLLFGIKVADNIRPKMHELMVYNLNHKRETQTSKMYKTRMRKAGDYYITGDTIEVTSSNVGLGLKVYDHMSGAPNWNGIYDLKMYVDDSLSFEFSVEELDFKEKKYINAHVDYKEKITKKSYFNRCYLLPGNFNSTIYDNVINNGVVKVGKEATKVRMETVDVEGNLSKVVFWLKKAGEAPISSARFNYILPFDEASRIEQTDLKLLFESHSFYETLYMQTDYTNDESSSAFSGVYHIHNETVPLQRPFRLAIRPTSLPDSWKEKAVISKCQKDGTVRTFNSTWEEDFLVAKPPVLGSFCVTIDTLPPTITPLSFSENRTKSSIMSFKIKDDKTGIGGYELRIDGEWRLLEYDGKKNKLFHKFDEKTQKGKHQMELIVTDNVGNTTVFEKPFTR